MSSEDKSFDELVKDNPCIMWPHGHVIGCPGNVISLTIKGEHPCPADFNNLRAYWKLITVEVSEDHLWYVGSGWFRLMKRKDYNFLGQPKDFEQLFFRADDIIQVISHSTSPYPPIETEETRWESIQ